MDGWMNGWSKAGTSVSESKLGWVNCGSLSVALSLCLSLRLCVLVWFLRRGRNGNPGDVMRRTAYRKREKKKKQKKQKAKG